jgi:1,2-diacylglycerol 3-alpha-glucosyltransferase
MRIALVTDTYAPSVNGVATFTAALARQLTSDGHEVALLAPAYPGRVPATAEGDVEAHRFTSIPLPFYSEARLCIGPQAGTSVRSFLDDFRPDVAHLQTHFFLARHVLQYCRQHDIPCLATCHSNSENFLLNMPILGKITPTLSRLYWRDAISFYSKVQLMTVPAAPMGDVLRHWGYEGPIRAVANGVDTTLFNPAPQTQDQDVWDRHDLPGENSLMFVGRLDKDKGVAGLLDLLQRMSRDELGHLIVCGSGIQAAYLRRVAEELGVGARVRFTGSVSPLELSSIYRRATALVMVGRNEVQPLAALEAMASGLPVVCLRTKNLEATVEPGVNGFLADSVDEVFELASTIFNDPNLRGRLGARARDTVEARFSLGRSAGEFLNWYTSVGAAAEVPLPQLAPDRAPVGAS